VKGGSWGHIPHTECLWIDLQFFGTFIRKSMLFLRNINYLHQSDEYYFKQHLADLNMFATIAIQKSWYRISLRALLLFAVLFNKIIINYL